MASMMKMTVTQVNGQKIYGPEDDNYQYPPKGSEIFIRGLPKSLSMDECIQFFGQHFPLFNFRLMMDFDGLNRGFGYASYFGPEQAKSAIEMYDGFAFNQGKQISVVKSSDNCRIFLGNIPRSLTESDIKEVMEHLTTNVTDVMLHRQHDNLNRGFCFIEYKDHRSAAIAKREIHHNGLRFWGPGVTFDWAFPEPEVNEDIMSTVKVVYLSNIRLETSVRTVKEAIYRNIPESEVERVTKVAHYAFVHFTTKMAAAKAIQVFNGFNLEGRKLRACWSRPPTNNNKSGERLLIDSTPRMANSVSYDGSSTQYNSSSSLSTSCSGMSIQDLHDQFEEFYKAYGSYVQAAMMFCRTLQWGEVSFEVIKRENVNLAPVTTVMITFLTPERLVTKYIHEVKTTDSAYALDDAALKFVTSIISINFKNGN